MDSLRVILVDFSTLQQQCQFYNILEAEKTIMSMNGLIALFSRLLPQAFVLQQTVAQIQAAWAIKDYITTGNLVGGLAKIVIGQAVNR